ncbi:hypothetical protein MLH21_01035, partial [Escherichia coli]|nr:hypothetical protein [Escherichia coli]
PQPSPAHAQPSPAQPSPAQPSPAPTNLMQSLVYKLLHILFVKFHYYQRLTSIGKGCHSVILTIINYYSPLFSIQIL